LLRRRGDLLRGPVGLLRGPVGLPSFIIVWVLVR
jgi:hypothetical protein